MKKAVKTIVCVLLALGLTLALLGFGMVAFVSWVWVGVRFSPEAAMEAVGIGHSQQERIETSDGYFYYETIADCYETADDMQNWIIEVTPVEKTGLGMWHAVTRPSADPLYVDGTDEYVGFLISVEGKDVYHHFFLVSVGGTNPPTLPVFLADGYTHATADGQQVEMWKHSYFVTDSEITRLEINGVVLTTERS